MSKMTYIIDGHNLIGKIRDIDLAQMDDEEILISRMQEFCRLQQKNVELYFDGAPPGKGGTRSLGRLKVFFVRSRSDADTQIIRRLHQLGNAAKNWIVVTSDRKIQNEARNVYADVIPSEDFARKMRQPAQRKVRKVKGKARIEPKRPSAEVREYMQLFGLDEED